MDDDKIKSIKHSAGAAILIIVVFMLCVYVVEPIINNVFMLFGTYFVPERFGGGSFLHEKSLLQYVFWLALTIYLSGYLAYNIASKIFVHKTKKATFIFAGVFVLLFFSVFQISYCSNKVKYKKSTNYSSKTYDSKSTSEYDSYQNSNIQLPPALPAQISNEVNMSITVKNSCSASPAIGYILYKPNSATILPSSGYHWTAQYGKPVTNNISCIKGEPICYGASALNYSLYWGLGVDKSNSCTDCCITCENTNRTWNLECNNNYAETPIQDNKKVNNNNKKKNNNIDLANNEYKTDLLKRLNSSVPSWMSLISGRSQEFYHCIRSNPNSYNMYETFVFISENNMNSDQALDFLAAYDTDMVINAIASCR